ncbi:hypothetical protein L6452_16980 [Arctium lappa]|uniref:Uncharacterized protein n=1 Tax=Arctium lappa TaxID=4217 RepID=A0ACB9C209_ARCLA|nr:hypothetical protein L6452_16980 [Arctium lappa]
MVLQTERCPGAAFQQQSHWSNQESGGRIQDGGYRNFSTVNGHTTPCSNYSQVSTYSSGNPHNHQSGWSTGADYHGNGASYYPGGGQYESSFHGSSHSHGSSFSHGHNIYGNGVNYNHSPNGMNYGYQKVSWTLKNVDDE